MLKLIADLYPFIQSASCNKASSYCAIRKFKLHYGKSSKNGYKTKDQKAAAEAKNWTKVIKAVRSPKSGAYTFKEQIIHKDKVKDFLATK